MGLVFNCLTTHGAEQCCLELVPNYALRKREVWAAIVNAPNPVGTGSDYLVESTGEPRWLVCHIMQDAERHGYIKIHPVFGHGHEYYSIESVSINLKRKLQEHKPE